MMFFNEEDNFSDIYTEIIDDIMSCGVESSPRGIKQKEILNLSYCLTNPHNHKLRKFQGIERKPNYTYAEEFFQFVMSGENKIPEKLIDLNPYAGQFDYTKDNMEAYDLPENFSFFYGPRIAEQLPEVIEELRQDRDTRRATISILYGGQDNKMLEGMRDGKLPHLEYPCTISIQFLLREGVLNGIVNMRSQNMISVFPYDVYNFSKILIYVASKLDVIVGNLWSNIGSAHIYEKDYKFANSLFISN